MSIDKSTVRYFLWPALGALPLWAIVVAGPDYFAQFAALLLIFVMPALPRILLSFHEPFERLARGFIDSFLINLALVVVSVGLRFDLRPLPYFLALLGFTLARTAWLLRAAKNGQGGNRQLLPRPVIAAAVVVVLAALVLSLWGALKVVPILQDHDSVMECPTYGLAKTLKPYCIETRVPYSFAKGPTSHFCYAFPLLLTDRLDRVKHYYDTSRQSLELRDFKRQIVGLWHQEFKGWFPRQSDQVLVETRTTSVFLSVLLCLLLFLAVQEITGSAGKALLLTLLFMTLPEIFVRNAYAGYQNASNIFLLIGIVQFMRRRETWIVPILLATTNQKGVIVLGLACVFWLLWQRRSLRPLFSSKTLWALFLGMLLLYAYGYVIHPPSLLQDQFEHHGVDRVLHRNPLPGMQYPPVPELWREFAFNYGPLLILCALAAGFLLLRHRRRHPEELLLLLVVLVTAAAFSVVDWKMTKHLDLLVPSLILLLARGWVLADPAPGFPRRTLAGVATCLFLYNGWILWHLAQDFNWLTVLPIW